MRVVNVADHVKGVVQNLRAADPRLAELSELRPGEYLIADWRIDFAHRLYSVSEDFGDDSKVFDWLPDDTEEYQWDYVNKMQIGDMWRTIRELERYNAELQRQNFRLSSELKIAYERLGGRG